MTIRKVALELASQSTSFRRKLIASLLKESMNFPSEEALRKYLKLHPGADRKNHTVAPSGKKDRRKKNPIGDKGKLTPGRNEDIVKDLRRQVGEGKEYLRSELEDDEGKTNIQGKEYRSKEEKKDWETNTGPGWTRNQVVKRKGKSPGRFPKTYAWQKPRW